MSILIYLNLNNDRVVVENPTDEDMSEAWRCIVERNKEDIRAAMVKEFIQSPFGQAVVAAIPKEYAQ